LNASILAGRMQASPVVFAIDPAQSQLTLSGKIAGQTLTTQGAGSLTTTYSGNINANISSSTIQFTGSSTITAKTNGVWQPAVGGGAGSAAADYGALATIPFVGTAYGALRNLVFDVTSASLTLTGTNFDSSALVFSFTPGSNSSLDYNAVVANGTQTLSGYSTNTVANQASLSTNGNVEQLVIHINTQFIFTLVSPGDTPLRLTGQIVATNSTTPPLINSIVLTNQNVVLTVANASTQSLLQSSSNLMTWFTPGSTVTNSAGMIIFTVPAAGPHAFFRVQK
jgi:hypothetical protein